MFRPILTVVACLAASPAHAQWVNHPSAGIPRTSDGKPNLSARAPRTVDGRPDLSGIWTTDRTPLPELERLFPGVNDLSVPGDGPEVLNKYFFNMLLDFKPEDSPLRKEFVPLLMQRAEGQGKDLPTARCLPAGVPMGDLLALPRRIVQSPHLLVMLSEANPPRLIHTDGRKPLVDPEPSWLGYSVGSWQGDTLVIETTGFNDKTWLDVFGHPRSEAMRITERLRRRDFGHMDVEVTINDAKVYTKPFSVRYAVTLTPDTDLLETVCENERDMAHMVGK